MTDLYVIRRHPMPSPVKEYAAASSDEAVNHFSKKFSFETDCWDVHYSISQGKKDFVLIDVRSPAMYEKSYIPGAINIPHGKINQRRMAEFPGDTLFVVYCAGPHCNGSTRAALRLAQLGLKVKEMIGGMTGWADEGFAFAHGTEIGELPAIA